MRNAFADEIKKLALMDERVVLLSGDIGNRLFNPYKEACPDRFYNCGVAEANMASMAAGMAMCGLRPVTYTITPFNTFRCLEQIRIDICYHNLPVIIVGVGSGFCYAGLGATHHSMEDVSVLRSLPNMTVVCPADAAQTRISLRKALSYNSPVYLRLGKKNEPAIYETEPEFEIGRGLVLRRGEQVCLVGSGFILAEVMAAAKKLAEKGIQPTVVDMHTIKPLDGDLLDEICSNHELVVTIEEHGLIGGLGTALAEWRADRNIGSRLLRIGAPDAFVHQAGEQNAAREMLGLSAKHIADQVQKALAV